MASTTRTTAAPPNFHLSLHDEVSRGAPSDLGTLDRLDSPGAESSVSNFTRAAESQPPTQENPYQLHPNITQTGSLGLTRPRTNSNKLSPPQEQGEWAQPRTSADGQAPPGHSRQRSNSGRYYAEARERSGTVNSSHSQGNNGRDQPQLSATLGPPTQPQPPQEPPRGYGYPTSPSQNIHPIGPAPPYSSPTNGHFAPKSSPQPGTTVQPDIDPSNNALPQDNDNNPAMVTPLEHLGTSPALVDCPRCQTQTRTVVTKEAGDAVTLWAVVLCCLTGVLCAWLPCVIDDCKDTVHRCSQCGLLLATVTSSGSVRIAQGVSKPVVSQYQRQQQMEANGEKPPETQQRDAGQTQAPAWGTQQPQQQPYGQYPEQPRQTEVYQAASVPVAELPDTSDPVELPAAMGAGWLGESSKSPVNEKEGVGIKDEKLNEKSRSAEKDKHMKS